MRDRTIVLAIVIIVTAFIVGCFLLDPWWANGKNYAGDSVVTGYDKLNAARIATMDPEVRGKMVNYIGDVWVGTVTPLGSDGAVGYVNYSDMVVQVPIQMGHGINSDRYVVYVDVNHSKVIGKEWYSYRGFPATADITIPQGSCWYHVIYGPIQAFDGIFDTSKKYYLILNNSDRNDVTISINLM